MMTTTKPCDLCDKPIKPGEEIYQDADGYFVEEPQDHPNAATVCRTCAAELVAMNDNPPVHDKR